MGDLPKDLIDKPTAIVPRYSDKEVFSQQQYDDYEQNLIWQLMKDCNGNKSAIAKRLGISRPTLYNKLNKYNIK
jgi:transcriptional regulator with PAS, ATPase and Fis domain